MNPLIVVTGGTKGIGRAIADRFVAEGFDAVICARSVDGIQSSGESTLGESTLGESTAPAEVSLRNAGPRRTGLSHRPGLLPVAADLSTRDGVTVLLDYIQSLNRPVDVLVNNTGVFQPGQIHNEAEGTFEQLMNTNVASAYHLTRGLVRDMMIRRQGHIFMMCSTASITPYTNGGSYCISKFALLGMSRVLREELKPHNVKVTAILPGATLTASWEGTELPEERFMKSDDVADSAWAAYSLSKSAVMEEILIRPQLGDI